MLASPFYLHAWKKFVNEGVLDSNRINQRISESWHRCKQANVNPHMNKGQKVLSSNIFREQKKKSEIFLDIALPQIQNLRKTIDELQMMALLIDPDGYVLSLSGNKQTLKRAKHINFIEGVKWTEAAVGTNAIGTALEIEEAIMISGTEHYSVASHSWSCAAAPIHNDDGKLIGILDFSCPIECSHPYMLGMVTSIAHAIERECSIRVHQNELHLIHRFLDVIDSDEQVVICNHRDVIVSASKSVRERVTNWSRMKLEDLVHHGLETKLEIPVYSNERMIGKCMYLKENKQMNTYSAFTFIKGITFPGVTGTSKAFQHTLEEIKLVSPTDASVYVCGETGVGKEYVARAIHENSPRKDGPFIAVNCGSLPKELMESELFGYAEGAFTGARRQGYKGKFEQANGGTLFLDEIGEVPPEMQVALLRVLQERTITPIGSSKEVPVNIRIITATHKDLLRLVEEGKFRQDLYYRLHVYPLYVPSLIERKEDIPYFIQHFCERKNWNVVFPKSICNQFLQHTWPGNIRELVNALERIYILSQGREICEKQVAFLIQTMMGNQQQLELQVENKTEHTLNFREKIQRDSMIEALEKTNGNVSLAAKLLDVPRSTFYKRMQKYKL
ncbi:MULTISPECIES: sigma-54-dependent Fis family transcriptional regulator [Bacillus]|uniref:Sigma-54-dependent Fis family transcriptional regulator n=1 Tax=Bacillus thuringiensis subsp. darmstadiensis TaxID=132264 RepID=A0A9X6IVV3_BACUD|nr:MULTISPECIES: sigma-54-dependent Fis family transcriptional regulator [Bacillus]MED2682078.1 sigma-54-dependent Fis family transcriptional regulator [Bacillus thuringiensis]ADH07286.1 sigma-54-dependent transcriptional activator [Bacillus thuringiensis BMB171]ALZ61503.1 Acetoin dehydrogenase operon transcriptional activator AcoR [Bacillus cereus]ASK14882.1 sigma-54-dependent Fis family transcriptional regulator [Bacillus cereus]EEK94620.1 Sigma-54 dependent transcriptional regulator [Bacill